jgi:hypothetical protein
VAVSDNRRRLRVAQLLDDVTQRVAYARKQARLYLNKLGIDPDELAKQYPQLAAGRSGRRKHPEVSPQLLIGLEMFIRAYQHDYDGRNKPALTRKKLILWYAELSYRSYRCAARDTKAYASGLEKGLQRAGLRKIPDEELMPLPPGLPPGIKEALKIQWGGTRLKPPKKYFSV